MTNTDKPKTYKDKYLKDGIDVKQLSREMFNFLVNDDIPLKIHIELFFEQPIKPTLTEDEKVILRNLQPAYEKIKRYGWDLYVLYNNGTCSDDIPLPFNGLFQFIQPRRRI